MIESCLGLTLSEFITACKEPGGPIALYMVDSESGEWNTTSDYTAGGSGMVLATTIRPGSVTVTSKAKRT